jgi:hypothetical protein
VNAHLDGWLRPFLVTALAVALLAGPVAVLWAHVVPHAGFAVDPFGFEGTVGANGEFIRADGWFLVMTAIVGALTGAVAWWLTAGRSPAAVAGLAAGGVFASYAVAHIGAAHNRQQLHVLAATRRLAVSYGYELGTPLHAHYPPLAHGSILAWSFFAVLVYGVLTLAITRP